MPRRPLRGEYHRQYHGCTRSVCAVPDKLTTVFARDFITPEGHRRILNPLNWCPAVVYFNCHIGFSYCLPESASASQPISTAPARRSPVHGSPYRNCSTMARAENNKVPGCRVASNRVDTPFSSSQEATAYRIATGTGFLRRNKCFVLSSPSAEMPYDGVWFKQAAGHSDRWG